MKNFIKQHLNKLPLHHQKKWFIRDWTEESFMGNWVYWDSVRHTERAQPLLGCIKNWPSYLQFQIVTLPVKRKMGWKRHKNKRKESLGMLVPDPDGQCWLPWTGVVTMEKEVDCVTRADGTHRKEYVTLTSVIYNMIKQCISMAIMWCGMIF